MKIPHKLPSRGGELVDLHLPISARWIVGADFSLDRGYHITNPNNALFTREFPQNHHTFVLFDPSQMGNLMTPVRLLTCVHHCTCK